MKVYKEAGLECTESGSFQRRQKRQRKTLRYYDEWNKEKETDWFPIKKE